MMYFYLNLTLTFTLFIFCFADRTSYVSDVIVAAEDTSFTSWLRQIRGELHAHPETSFTEFWTSDRLFKELTSDRIGVPSSWIRSAACPPAHKNKLIDGIPTSSEGTGLVIDIYPESYNLTEGFTHGILLRADMDALPIEELIATDTVTRQEIRSKIPKKAHLCGHDSHMSMLLGAVKLLVSRRQLLSRPIRILFQPAEEFGAGGFFCVKDNILVGVNRVFALHQMPHIPARTIAAVGGAIMGGANEFTCTLKCKGGHAGMPHTTVDVVLLVAEIVSSIQSIIGREIDALDSAVISITQLNANAGARNVVPTFASFGGTLRGRKLEIMRYLKDRIVKITELYAQAKSELCSSKCEFLEHPYPPTINHLDKEKDLYDPKNIQSFFDDVTLLKKYGMKDVEIDFNMKPLMAAEDFSFLLLERPGTYFALGSKFDEKIKSESFGLHSPYFELNEDIMSVGSASFVVLAVEQGWKIQQDLNQENCRNEAKDLY